MLRSLIGINLQKTPILRIYITNPFRDGHWARMVEKFVRLGPFQLKLASRPIRPGPTRIQAIQDGQFVLGCDFVTCNLGLGRPIFTLNWLDLVKFGSAQPAQPRTWIVGQLQKKKKIQLFGVFIACFATSPDDPVV